MKRETAAVLLLAAIMAGCSATKYQPEGTRGGFSEVQLDRNVFRITFSGNTYTKDQLAEDYALLRSAEVTLAHGFTHFVIVDGKLKENTFTYTSPVTTYSTSKVKGNNKVETYSSTSGGDTSVTRMPTVVNTIQCFTKRPDGPGMVYDARFLCTSLGGRYKVTCAS